ncbi:MAG: hypothetical protein M5U34_25995 [Chloroflexi bacterium]|nr:hypothetical protein [Chloroflexota bacterium]
MLGMDLSQRLWHGLWQDLGSFRASFSDLPTPTPGLQTFDVPLNGGQKRIHFRLEDDRSGVLFVDVTDVVHLNATAAEMAFLRSVTCRKARRGLLSTGGCTPKIVPKCTQNWHKFIAWCKLSVNRERTAPPAPSMIYSPTPSKRPPSSAIAPTPLTKLI